MLLKDQFPSNVYPWQKVSEKTGGEILQVQQSTGKSLTESVLNNLNEKVAVTALPNVLWTNGTSIDLMQIRKRCDEVGSRLVLDLTQSAGAMSIDFDKVRPDFAVVANYKWMLGPYTTGFLFVSPHYFEGVPLEEGWITRKDSKDFSNLINYTGEYEFGAIRFDMGKDQILR